MLTPSFHRTYLVLSHCLRCGTVLREVVCPLAGPSPHIRGTSPFCAAKLLICCRPIDFETGMEKDISGTDAREGCRPIGLEIEKRIVIDDLGCTFLMLLRKHD